MNIVDYVLNTPHNTNRVVLEQMVKELSSGSKPKVPKGFVTFYDYEGTVLYS